MDSYSQPDQFPHLAKCPYCPYRCFDQVKDFHIVIYVFCHCSVTWRTCL